MGVSNSMGSLWSGTCEFMVCLISEIVSAVAQNSVSSYHGQVSIAAVQIPRMRTDFIATK